MTGFDLQLYKQVLFKEKLAAYAKQRRFQSKRHHVFFKSITKKSFNSVDDKRFILENGYETLAHGHYKIPSVIENWTNTDQLENYF